MFFFIPLLTEKKLSWDHPSNKKRGNFCIYFKNYFPFKVSHTSPLERIDYFLFKNT